MKKRIIGLITIASYIALLCGCNKSDPQYSETNSDVSSTVSSTSGGTSDNDTLIFADFVGEYPENPLPLLTLSEEEIRRAANEQPNFECSENMYISIPESASVYEFRTYGTRVPQRVYSNDQFKKDYETAFKYFFPDREMNMDYLKYEKEISYEEGYEEGYVKDKETMPDGSVELIYDEMPERTETWGFPVFMDFRYEIGVGNGIINKGEAAYLAGKQEYDYMKDIVIPSDTYNTLREFELTNFFNSIGTYSPQSEKSFKLLDGEMKICDAVEFFENYVNNVPISAGLQRNERTRVYSVDVIQIDENTYGYYFNNQHEFQGVRYEPPVWGSISQYNYDGMGGEAYMLRHDDVDYIHGFYGNAWTFDVKPCEKIVPVETAIKAISENLTSAVKFEVLSIEFAYVQQFEKNEKGHIIIETYEANITPAWRITAWNPNDNLTYICYVDAIDGENFRYYSTSRMMDFD